MGLTCSLFGHRFDDPTVEHEREEGETEVVTATREVVVCERCGEERILSENKEVTAIVDPGSDTESVDAADERTADGASPGDEAADAPTGAESFDAGPVDPADEDAEIIEDGPPERGFGEWPSEDGERPDPWDPDAPLHPEEDESAETAPENETTSTEELTVAEATGTSFEETKAHEEGPDRLVCTECGFETGAQNSPLRDGDACPNCNAYLSAE